MDTRARRRRDRDRTRDASPEPQEEDVAPGVGEMQRQMEEMRRSMREMAETITDLRQRQAPPPPPPLERPFQRPEGYVGPPLPQEDHLPGGGNGGCLAFLRQFQHLRMQSFRGGVVTPRQASGWLKELKKQFEATQCPEEYKVSVATFYLKEDADEWWDEVKGRYAEGHRFSWREFQQEFEGQFYSATTREEMNLKFIQLVQGNRTVSEYAVEFRRLLKFAEHLVPTKPDKIAKFRAGLQPDIRALVELNDYPTLASIVSKAEQVERTQRDVTAQRAKARVSSSRGSFTPAQKGKAVAVPPRAARGTAPMCRLCNKSHFGECRRLTGKFDLDLP